MAKRLAEEGGASNENRVQSERQTGVDLDRRRGDAAALRAARRSWNARTALWLRTGPMRRLHGPPGWQGSPLLFRSGLGRGRQEGDHARRTGDAGEAASASAG